ncbi:TetR/AcrR family transcriptional regulator [Tabrizicola sp.]|uniref:TetR/AcrR family transcriptional regulator n=1 Tax=Tabrizicola sp. TaxID=2005166 RepID=UPI003F3CD2F5
MTDEQKTQGGLTAWRARVLSENRNTLLDAAIERFLAQGYDRTSLEEVARTAGLSSATLYKHFPTKAALFGGIMARLWDNDGDAAPVPPASGDPSSGLLAIGRDYAALLTQQRTVDLFRLVTAEVPRFPELGEELYERGKKPYLDRLHAYLSAEVALGMLAIDDVPLAARQFLGMINDIVFWPRLLIPSLVLPAKQVDRVVEEAVATMLSRYGAG